MQLVGGQKCTLLSKNILYLLINEQRNFVKFSTFLYDTKRHFENYEQQKTSSISSCLKHKRKVE